ncbi:MAG: FHA domain-containing protein [Phototrophicaceae bacterium]
MVKCKNCGHENPEKTLICETCGFLMGQPTTVTRVYDDADYEEGTSKLGVARFNGKTDLVIEVLGTKQRFIFDYDQITQIIIGRKDQSENNLPLVDLTESEGQQKGVSRRHAKIIHQDDALYIVDDDSVNGTYLNGHKLVAEQPRLIRDGDDVRLGHLIIRIKYRENN